MYFVPSLVVEGGRNEFKSKTFISERCEQFHKISQEVTSEDHSDYCSLNCNVNLERYWNSFEVYLLGLLWCCWHININGMP